MPTVSSSTAAHALSDRRGSEPALLTADGTFRQERGTSQWVVNVSNNQHNAGRRAADVAEEQPQGICLNGGN